jgi:hypothetical protein
MKYQVPDLAIKDDFVYRYTNDLEKTLRHFIKKKVTRSLINKSSPNLWNFHGIPIHKFVNEYRPQNRLSFPEPDVYL